jgi:DNA polymerase III sliding clamp (beta) subunit (PCNA family)
MIKATTTARNLLAWTRPIAAVSDECILDTSELDSVTTYVVDVANAQMISIRIPDHAWDDLEVDGSHIAVDLPSLIERIEQFHPDDQITLTTETDDDGMWLKITDAHSTYTMRIIDPIHCRKTPTEPTINSAAQFAITPDTLKRIIKQSEVVSDCIKIGMDPANEVWVLAKGETDKYDTHLSFDTEVIAHKLATVSSLFALDYLKDISPHLKGGILIGLGNDEAIQMCCRIHEASVRYIQAPRIE